jgi:hypothetical protein
MSQRTQIYLLIGLVVVLAIAVYNYPHFGRPDAASVSGVMAADTKFQPLDVQDPGLRIDELKRLSRQDTSGSHRNIFVAAPPPSAVATTPTVAGDRYPQLPPPPPPLQVPAEFFGYASQPGSGKRVAFFTAGDDVLVVAEGDKFLNNYRLLHVGNESAEVEEISSGRHQTMPLVEPPDQGTGNQ